ncbi:glycosyltransferase family 2 protein [Rhodocyclus tenuis]|uniref:Glycosyltransferase involved in cell wall biosynthesis n=1 Tax=Rhodocyclus tenuis TaxID=1066 RepID=A0A840G481_RHOTE|nr:glycosyltransferase family A protein [Rhodocyclus tenuis]MBB4247203.1 glycosyltransferase involved in cell wall biosynthesis [Rhodocyclus tenuis]
MSLLSLVLATYGRCDDVGRVLDSLLAQTDKDFEVLIVDQNADDRLAPHVRRGLAQGLNIRHLRLEKPSLAGARNLGIAEAAGEIVGFPDDDCWYEPETVAEVRRAFAASGAIDGIVGCWVEQSLANSAPRPFGRLSCAQWRQFRSGSASSITLFIQRSLLLRLGGFDQRFGVGQWYGAGEETDFILRALEAGACVEYRLEARVHHAFSIAAPNEQLLARCRAMRRRGRGTGGIYAKHQLSHWVIVRGVFGQFMRPLLRGELRQAAIGAFVSLGLLEGLVKWRFSETIDS